MRNEKSLKMDKTFFGLQEDEQMRLLGINDDTFMIPRFKGVARKTVISDLWNGKTNSERRKTLKVNNLI